MPSSVTSPPTCAGTGFIALDIVRTSEGKPAERHYAGGSCGNVLAILGYLGWTSHAIGRVGRDRAAKRLISDLRHFGVDTSRLQTDDRHGTPIVLQEVYRDRAGRVRHRFLLACPSCGKPFPRYRPVLSQIAAGIADSLPEHHAFFLDRVAPGPLEMARRSRCAGSLVVFEPSGIKDESLFVECLRASHVVKYSSERLPGVHALVAREAVPLEIETFGEDGLRFRLRGDRSWRHFDAVPAPSFRDAAGSGDWCTAGLIHRLAADGTFARRLSVHDAVVRGIRFGQALAALNCAYDGARGLAYSAEPAVALDAAAALAVGHDANLAAARGNRGRATRARTVCEGCATA